MDFFNDIFHNLALLEFYFLNIIYISLYIDFILSIFFQHSNILTRASHHWCLASNIVLVCCLWPRGCNPWPLRYLMAAPLWLSLLPTLQNKETRSSRFFFGRTYRPLFQSMRTELELKEMRNLGTEITYCSVISLRWRICFKNPLCLSFTSEVYIFLCHI